MNLPYSWLKEWVPDAPSVQDLSDLFPQIGLGVEAVHHLAAPPQGVVIGLVETVKPIDGSDHLKACTVYDGEKRYSVVCGAPNVREGMRSALAKPGVHLPGAGFTVEKRKMMGVASEGVLCSPKELELYEYGGGLIVFGDDAELGQELSGYWPEDYVLELEITPNRADAFSILGVARDLAAKLGVKLNDPTQGLELPDPQLDDGMTVKLEDEEGCPRFTLRRIEGVTVKPSPIWLQRRLAQLGLRPRNNIVDITNYITFELGHPSHAFDLDHIVDKTLLVRWAQEGEKLVTLNEEELELSSEDMLITMPDGQGGTTPISLAGVIGGLHDSINPNTTNVALELAHWNPVMIRKTAKRHGISTDAHYRFERGVDPNIPPLASARAAKLIAELAGGTLHPGITDVGSEKALPKIAFRPSRVHFLMAMDVPLKEQQRYLEALGFKVEIRAEDDWLVTAPSWRFDMAIEEDIIEEVSRMYGYEHVTETVPDMHFVPEGHDSTHRQLRNLMMGLGFQEAMTYVFTSDSELAKANAPLSQVKLANPQGLERSVLRTALYPGLLEAARTNHHQPGMAFFELGRVFLEQELEYLSIVMVGEWIKAGWQTGQTIDFYSFKGLLEKLAAQLNASFRLEPEQAPFLHPGVSAALYWQGEKVGYMGRLHPEVAARYELDEVFVAELNLPLAFGKLKFSDYARQPHAERDLAILVPKALSYAELAEAVRSQAGERLEQVQPFDIYEGQQVPEGQKSMALRLWFRHPERSLTDEEVDGFMGNIIGHLKTLGYTIRDS
ncbi:MAG: phenylalanine--tRNA ligase subunit beta [Trueperaceae bacterium]|nr:phenylalanine--tRNA ligase subunit beta [Trueperaceae bacterium]